MADFQVTASVDIQLSESEIKRVTKDLQRKMAATLKPLELKLNAPALRAVDQSLASIKKNMQGLTNDITSATRAIRAFGSAGVSAFRAVSVAKDSLRRNIAFLQADLRRLSNSITSNINIEASVSSTKTLVPNLQKTLDRSKLKASVIPELAEIAALRALPVPILPILPPIAITSLPVEVDLEVNEGALASVKKEVQEVTKKATEPLKEAAVDVGKKVSEGIVTGGAIDKAAAYDRLLTSVNKSLEKTLAEISGIESQIDAGAILPEATLQRLDNLRLAAADLLDVSFDETIRGLDGVADSVDNLIKKGTKPGVDAVAAGVEDMNQRINEINTKKVIDLKDGIEDTGKAAGGLSEGKNQGAAFLGNFEKRLPKVSELVQNAGFHFDRLKTSVSKLAAGPLELVRKGFDRVGEAVFKTTSYLSNIGFTNEKMEKALALRDTRESLAELGPLAGNAAKQAALLTRQAREGSISFRKYSRGLDAIAKAAGLSNNALLAMSESVEGVFKQRQIIKSGDKILFDEIMDPLGGTTLRDEFLETTEKQAHSLFTEFRKGNLTLAEAKDRFRALAGSANLSTKSLEKLTGVDFPSFFDRFKDERGAFGLFGKGKNIEPPVNAEAFDTALEGVRRFSRGLKPTIEQYIALMKVGKQGFDDLMNQANLVRDRAKFLERDALKSVMKVAGRGDVPREEMALLAEQKLRERAEASAQASAEAAQKKAQNAQRRIQREADQAAEKARESALRAQEELDDKIRKSINTQIDAQTAAEPALKKILADRVNAEKQASREIRRASKADRDDQAREAQAAIDRATEVEAVALKKQQKARERATKDLNNQLIQAQRAAGDAFDFKFTGLDDGLRKLGLLKDESNKLGTDDSFNRYVASLEKAAPAIGLAAHELDNLVDLTRRFGHFVPPGGFEIVSERNREAARSIVRDFSNATQDAGRFEQGIRALNRTFGISIKQLEEFAGRSIGFGKETGALSLGFLPDPAKVLARVRKIRDGINKALSAPGGDFTAFGKSIINSIGSSLKNAKNAVGVAISQLSGVIDPASVGLGREAGRRISEGIQQGLNTAARGAGRSLGQFLPQLTAIRAQGISFFGALKLGAAELNKTFAGLSNTVQGLARSFVGLAAPVAAFLSASTLFKSIGLAAQFEQTRVALGNLLGGATAASIAIDEARRIASETGIAIGEVTTAIQKLVAQGLTLEQATAEVELFARATIAAGKSTEEFVRAVTALGQVISKGVLSQEELRQQLAEQLGLRIGDFYKNLAAELSKTAPAAVTVADAIKAIEEGAVPSEVAIRALNKTLVETPGVMNAASARAATLRGVLDKLRTAGFIALEKAAGSFVKTFTGVLQGAGVLDLVEIKDPNTGEVTKQLAFTGIVADNLKKIFTALAPVAKQLVDQFVAAVPSVTSLAISLIQIVRASLQVTTGLTPVIQVFANLVEAITRIRPLMVGLIASFVAFKVASIVTGILSAMTTALVALPPVLGVAGTAVQLFGLKVQSALGPIGFLVGLLTAIGVAAFAAGKGAKGAVGDITKLVELIEAVNVAASDQEVVDQFFDKFRVSSRDSGTILKKFQEFFKLDPAAAKRTIDALKARGVIIRDEEGNVVDLAAEYERLVALDKERNQELLKSLGLTNDLTDATKEFGKAARDANEAATDTIKDALADGQELISAQLKVQDSKDREKEISDEIAELQKELAEATADTGAKTEEILDAKKRIADIDRQIRDLIQEQGDEAFRNAQRLDELADRRDDFADRLVELGIAEERLQIRKARNLEEINRLQEEGVEGSSAFVNIAGLSLDAARARLAAVRSTLAAQRAGKKTQDEETDKALDLRDAKLEQQEIALEEANQAKNRRDLERERIEFEEQNRIADREHIDFVKDSEADLIQLRKDRKEAEEELTKILTGQSEVDKEIARIKEQIRKKQEEYKKQVQQTTIAEKELNYVLAEQAGTVGDIAKAATELLDATSGQLRDTRLIGQELEYNKKRINDQFDIYVKRASEPIPPLTLQVDTSQAEKKIANLAPALQNALNNQSLGTGLLGVGRATEIANGFAPGTVAEALAAAANALAEAASRQAINERNLEEIARSQGIPQRAFAAGGYIPSQGPFGETIRVAEAGAEAVLPLTNKARMRAVVNDPRVLDPVLAALPQIQLPCDKLSKSSGEPVRVSEQERRKQQKELAGYLADAIVAKAGDLGKDVVINQTFETGQYIDTNQLARKAAREAERQWRNRNQ